MRLRERAVLFFSTGGYVGYISFAPGTVGSLVGLPFCYFLSRIDDLAALLWTAVFISLAIWITGIAERILKTKDPGCIIIDEIAGLMVTLLGLRFNILIVASGFIVFRIFDILKPFPIRFLERNLSGGFGIVLDDVAAGLYSNLLIRAMFLITLILS